MVFFKKNCKIHVKFTLFKTWQPSFWETKLWFGSFYHQTLFYFTNGGVWIKHATLQMVGFESRMLLYKWWILNQACYFTNGGVWIKHATLQMAGFESSMLLYKWRGLNQACYSINGGVWIKHATLQIVGFESSMLLYK